MNYSVGDKVELKDDRGKTHKVYLMALCIQHKHYTTTTPIWEARFTRKSHLILISEKMIVRKISSKFEEFFPETKAINNQQP